MNKAEIISEIKKLDLPLGSYVVISGTSLAMRGIRNTRDIDMLVLPKIIQEFRKKGFKERIEKDGMIFLVKDKFEVGSKLKTTGYHANTGEIIKNSEIINGIPCSKLNYEIKFKTAWAREKDFIDIKLIEEYLKKHAKN